MTAIREARLEGQAIRNGWGQSRYPVYLTQAELVEQVKQRGSPTFAEKLLLSVYSGLDCPYPRTVRIAERNGISIMRQVQSDEHHADDSDKPRSDVNVNVGLRSGVQFYLPENGRDTDGGNQAAIAQEPEYLEWRRQRFLKKRGSKIPAYQSTPDSQRW